MNASLSPTGENSGLESAPLSATIRCAAPPADGTSQIAPPETNAMRLPSGEIAGSAKLGRDLGAESTAAWRGNANPANTARAAIWIARIGIPLQDDPAECSQGNAVGNGPLVVACAPAAIALSCTVELRRRRH